MANKYPLEALDKTLRDIIQSKVAENSNKPLNE